MQRIPKSGILKVSTLSESLASSSSLSRRGRISRAHQSKQHVPRSTSNILRRLSKLGSQSSASTAAATRNVHNEATAQTNDVKQRRVRFNTISIREYEIQPSDNPSSMFSPGLELGWKYNVLVSSFSIDTFESQRVIQRQPQYQQRPLSIKHRRLLLQEFGFSTAEIEAASFRARTLREERERSIERMHLDWYDRIVEDLRLRCSSRTLQWSCKVGSAVVDGVEMKRENGNLLHPSMLVDTSVEASSFFDASLKKDNQQQVMLDDDDVATKGQEAPKD